MPWIDSDCLPETSGVVDCFLLNEDGEADGLVLQDGKEVHFPPHMGGHVLAAVRPGSTVQIRGIRPRGVAMVAAVSIAPEDGARIVDSGPLDDDEGRKSARKRAHAGRTTMEAQGVVRQLLHGPRDEGRGVLLQDGRSGRFPPHAALDITVAILPNMKVLLRGDGLATPDGTFIAIREIGTSAGDFGSVEANRPKKDHKPHWPSPHGRNSGDTHPLGTDIETEAGRAQARQASCIMETAHAART